MHEFVCLAHIQQLSSQPSNPQTTQTLQKITRQKELLEQMLNQKVLYFY